MAEKTNVAEKAVRFQIRLEGTPISFRVVPHAKDAGLVMLKVAKEGAFLEALLALLEVAGVQVQGKVLEGRNFLCVAIERAALLALLGVSPGAILDAFTARIKQLAGQAAAQAPKTQSFLVSGPATPGEELAN